MRLFPIISVAMRVAVMAKPTRDMEDDLFASDFDTWADSSDFSASDSNTWADTTNKPKETKTGRTESVISPKKST